MVGLQRLQNWYRANALWCLPGNNLFFLGHLLLQDVHHTGLHVLHAVNGAPPGEAVVGSSIAPESKRHTERMMQPRAC